MSAYIGKRIQFKNGDAAVITGENPQGTRWLLDSGRTAKKSTEGVVWDLIQYNVFLLRNIKGAGYDTNVSAVFVAAGASQARQMAKDTLWGAERYDHGEDFWLRPDCASVTQIGIALKTQAVGLVCKDNTGA